MNQLLSIVDDALVIKKLSVQTLDGPIQTTDDLRVQGNIFVDRDIKARQNMEVSGTLIVDTLKVKNFQAANELSPEINPNRDFTFIGRGEKQIDGKGLIWVDGISGSKQFVYKEGNKLWSTMNIDLAGGRSYQINRLDVLTATELGSTVVNSNLTTVGELNGLKVCGQVEFDNWVFFNSYNNRLGINTESPNATLGVVVENGIEVIIGHTDSKTAKMGTFTCNNLDLITDNKVRMSLKENGEITFGNPKFKNASVKIFGRLEVDQLITSSSNQEQSVLVFKNTETRTVYQTGILWKDESKTRQFVYAAQPDRIFTTEIIDLAQGKYYSIDNDMVLSRNMLGNSVTESNLEQLGRLRNLEVLGEAKLLGPVNIPTLTINQLSTADNFSVSIDHTVEFKITNNGDITIGIEENKNRNINLYGQTQISGSLNINNKRIFTGSVSPTLGQWNKGDICYNDNPEMEGYIGWVCVQSGEPGRWCPFGLIMPVRS